MKPDDHLGEALRRLQAPPPDIVARDRALHRAIIALGAGRAASPPAATPRAAVFNLPRWALAGVAATLLFVVALDATLTTGRREDQHLPALAAEHAVLFQMESLFGKQLDAIVESPDKAPDIHLSDDSSAAARLSLAQPVVIQFQRTGGGTTRVLSFSGRTVCVTLGGHRMCFEPLVTGRDEVILSGDAFCWTPEDSSRGFNGYQVTARLLPRS
jgi:hypothetical protein